MLVEDQNFIGNNSNTSQASWIGIGSLATFGLSLITVAVLSRYLNKEEYGTYRQILFIYNTLLVIFTAGLPRVFNYYLPRFELSEGKEIVLKISKVLFLTGLLFSVFLFTTSGVIANILKNPELSKGLKYFSPVPMLLLPTLGIEGIFSTYRRTIYIAIYNILTRTIMLVFIVAPVVIFSGGYIFAVYGWIISSFIIFIIAFYYKNIPFRGILQKESGLGFREILNYSLPLVSASIAGMIYRGANQFYISRYFGPEVFAEFSNGFIEIPFVHMITGATSTVLMPVFSKIVYEKSDISKITELWQSALNKSAILIYPIVIYFIFYSKELVTIVFSETYANSAKYFSVAMIINFFNIIVFAPLLLSLGKSKFYARFHYGLAIITWVVEYLAIIIFKTPISIAITFVVIATCGSIIPLAYIAKCIKVSIIRLFPIVRLLVIAMHSFIAMFLVNFSMRRFLAGSSDLLFVTIAGLLYLGMLLISAKWFKIKYWDIVRPLLKNNKSHK